MKKKILFVNDEMVVGGVARVLNNLFSGFDFEHYEVDLLVLHKHGEMLDAIPETVRVISGSSFFDVVDLPLNELIKKKDIIKIIKKLYLVFLLKTGLIEQKIQSERKKMNLPEYDAEIAFKEGFCSVFVGCGNTKKKINWIHVDYKIMNYSKNYMTLLKKILPRFDAHVAVSKQAAKSYQEVFGLQQEVQVIHNVIKDDIILSKAEESVDYRDETLTLVSVGRLHYQKAYDRQLEILYELKQRGYQFKCYILGDGEEKESLLAKHKALQLEDCCFFLGNQRNPYTYLKQADLFLLASLYEGLPTVVFESLIVHTPVFSSRVAGVEEQLMNKYGMIVENSKEAIIEGLSWLMDHPEELRRYKEACKDYRYENDEIYNEVYQLLEG